MPVRFRCSYCNQLLGISRRKIGATIKCPTCQGQVLVPPRDSGDLPRERIEQEPMEPPAMPGSARDFDGLELDLLRLPQKQAPPPPPPAAPPDINLEIDVEPIPSTQTGIVLRPRVLSVLLAALILALALAFAAGLLVGKSAWR